jgi:hypothetical protein
VATSKTLHQFTPRHTVTHAHSMILQSGLRFLHVKRVYRLYNFGCSNFRALDFASLCQLVDKRIQDDLFESFRHTLTGGAASQGRGATQDAVLDSGRQVVITDTSLRVNSVNSNCFYMSVKILNVRPARSELNGAELVYCAHTAFPLLS